MRTNNPKETHGIAQKTSTHKIDTNNIYDAKKYDYFRECPHFDTLLTFSENPRIGLFCQ